MRETDVVSRFGIIEIHLGTNRLQSLDLLTLFPPSEQQFDKDVTVATDDYLMDQVERSQQHQTRRRRDGRARRRRIYLLFGLLALALLILGAPSLLSHSPMGRSIVARTLQGYGLQTQMKSARFGWITPLRITELEIEGQQAGSKISVQQLDSSVTISQLITGNTSDFGSVAVRGLSVACTVSPGRCSLEDDLQSLLAPSEQPASSSGVIQVQDASVSVTDTVTGQTWTISQANVDVEVDHDELKTSFAGLLAEPGGSGGSLQGAFSYASNDNATNTPWTLDLETRSLPLSVVSLVRQRFPNTVASLPTQFAGDASGSIQVAGTSDGAIQSSVHALEVRNLVASHGRPQSRVWNNSLASISGDLVIQGDRVIGTNLNATTDFAAATFNGAFSRSFSLVGAEDNPLQWLDALDGAASVEVDLALLDESLPGVLPLRDEAQVVSGRATASVRSLPNDGVLRSQLFVRCDAVRARARGRAIVIEPIEVGATVANRDGVVKAEQFKLSSSFASAVGKGSMRSGQADFQIDFGKLGTMLRPLVDLSKTTLSGSSKGSIQWNASNDNIWRLRGNGDASNLMISLADGRELKRQALRTDVEAVGRWGGEQLELLSSARLTVKSDGLDLTAELVKPVANPSSNTSMPIKIRGNGRIETLAETLGPWLPGQLHDAQGGFSITADVDASSIAGQIQRGTIDLTNPRMAYGQRRFQQPNLKIEFDGLYAWPSGDFDSRKLTAVGEAVSLAVQGKANADTVDLQIAWKAKLERLQGSVLRRTEPWNSPPVRSASFRPEAAPTDDWLLAGDCGGKLTIKSHDHILDIDSETNGTNVSLIQPSGSSAKSQTVGPMPRTSTVGFKRNGNHQLGDRSRVVWWEPNLKLSGLTHYNLDTGEVTADGIQVSSDWLVTTLSGSVLWNQATEKVSLTGPARLKMNEVSRRLTNLFGTNVRVDGIHETPLEIHVDRGDDAVVAFSVAGNLGWSSGEIGGVQFGEASVPVRLTETTVEVDPAVIPVGEGHLNLAGEVFYRPGPVWLRTRSGVGAKNVRLTQQMTNRWMKYLAPLLADATRIDGSISAELDEAIVVVDNPEQSRVRGRLIIEGAQMYAGPLAKQIIYGVEQLKQIAQLNARTLAGATNTAIGGNPKLVSMPAQKVEFAVQQGFVQHDRLFFEVDRAQVVTSGRVGLDGTLQLDAQVFLDASWLGSDLQSLAGQPVALPVRGTLSQPRLDSSGVREVVTQLGAQAARSTAEGYLQKQLNKGLESIFGR